MKYISLLFAIGLILLSMQSCDKAPLDQPNVVLPDSLREGIFVLNEGNFQSGNASLDYIDVYGNAYYSDVFKVANGKPLGDVLQSMNIINDKIYLVINNSGKIEIVDKKTFKSISTISGLRSPRYILPISSNKAYVSDLYDNSIAVVDLSNNSIIKKIQTQTWTEQMILSGNNVLITCPNSKYILGIDIATDEIKDSIELSYGTESIQQQNDSTYWILCSGNQTKNINAGLYKIIYNNSTFKVSKTFVFASNELPNKLLLNKNKTSLYWIKKDIYKMSVSDSILPNTPLIYADGKNYYGMALDKKYDELYVSDVLDYVQKSKAYRYSATIGQIKGLFNSGTITRDFYFNY
ncbi:MAG: hypothetical protein NTU43_07030 [Bacteroidetes bacterium]|nr:hypothetical protein [Bacteroidota bacterium]